MPTPEASTLAWIVRQQRSNGSFTITGTAGAKKVQRSVALSLHALLLDLLHDSAIPRDTTDRLASYLVDVLRPGNFASTLAETDTRAVFHALAAVYEYDAALISADVVATSIHFLTTHETAAGGPYLNAVAHRQVPDLATNVSISRFVHSLGGPFSRLMAYITTATEQGVDSPYFTAAWPLQLQFAKMRNTAGLPANESLIDGELPAESTRESPRPIYKDLQQTPAPTYGMATLQAARALFAVNRRAAPQPRIAAPQSQPADRNATPARILKRAQAANTHDPLIAASTKTMLARVAKADASKEIGLLALRFAPALRIGSPPRAVLEGLGVANLYNWAAYTVYDDILDGDSTSDALPAANTALRTAVRLFTAAVPAEAFRAFVDATFNAVDTANAWELVHCRFVVAGGVITIGPLPDYDDLQNLYGRSLTHCLPVMGTLASAGNKPEGHTGAAVLQAFKQYLIIRQLSDDLHDWQADLRAGLISYVVARTLADAHIGAGKQALDILLPRLERTFFRKTLPALGKDMLARATQAHALLDEAAHIDSPNVIDTLIGGIEHSTRRMLSEHSHMSSLIEAYRA